MEQERIMTWVKTYKTALIGAVFFICLSAYGWQYGFIEQSQAVWDTDMLKESENITSRKQNGRYSKSQETDSGQHAQRILSIRQNYAGLPLRDPFLGGQIPVKGVEGLGQIAPQDWKEESSIKKGGPEETLSVRKGDRLAMEGIDNRSRRGTQRYQEGFIGAENDRYSPRRKLREGGTTKADPPHVEGVIMGTVPRAMVRVAGRTQGYAVGEGPGSFTVVSISRHRIVLSNGIVWEG